MILMIAVFMNPDMSSKNQDETKNLCSAWCTVGDVSVNYIGIAKKGTIAGVILSSFNAG